MIGIIRLAFFIVFLASSAIAYGGGGGEGGGFGTSGDGCGCVPPSLEEDARNFEEQIREYDIKKSRRLQFVGELCAANGFDCGKLSESQASRLLDHHVQTIDVARARDQEWWRWCIDIALALIAFAGLFLGVVNYWAQRKSESLRN